MLGIRGRGRILTALVGRRAEAIRDADGDVRRTVPIVDLRAPAGERKRLDLVALVVVPIDARRVLIRLADAALDRIAAIVGALIVVVAIERRRGQQFPVAGLHSSFVHTLLSLQTTFGVNVHVPVAGLQTSRVQKLLSLQITVGVNTHVPVAGLQASLVQRLLSVQVDVRREDAGARRRVAGVARAVVVVGAGRRSA